MADIILRSESQGVRPHFALELVHEWRGVQTQGRYRAGHAVNDRPVRFTRLTWSGTDLGQRHLLNDAWKRSGGGIARMDWTPPGDVDANKYEVQFVPGTREVRRVGLDRFDMAVTIREAH